MKLSIFHISEIYLYEYYLNNFDYEINDQDLVKTYVDEALEEEKQGNIDKALQLYLKAHMENPVKYELHNNIIRCCRQLNDLEGMYNYTLESHKFCCTRSELASFYRNLGYYYLEKYKPQLALDLYRYSILFYENENADHEIEFLKAAMGEKIKDNTVEEIQNNLKGEQIPITADNVTMALLVKAGQEAEEKEAFEQALDCYNMVYDLTSDEEILNKIQLLSK